jgi:hypothetical protein
LERAVGAGEPFATALAFLTDWTLFARHEPPRGGRLDLAESNQQRALYPLLALVLPQLPGG